ncbi:hypothetical protein E2542_SST17713 [Spatholobus suberectus]|nr:hypothetical protein E2542_SST17713 [Spatholobus suberectus]
MLSTGNLTAYINCDRLLKDLVQLVKERVEEQNLLELLGNKTDLSSWSSFSSFSLPYSHIVYVFL